MDPRTEGFLIGALVGAVLLVAVAALWQWCEDRRKEKRAAARSREDRLAGLDQAAARIRDDHNELCKRVDRVAKDAAAADWLSTKNAGELAILRSQLIAAGIAGVVEP